MAIFYPGGNYFLKKKCLENKLSYPLDLFENKKNRYISYRVDSSVFRLDRGCFGK